MGFGFWHLMILGVDFRRRCRRHRRLDCEVREAQIGESVGRCWCGDCRCAGLVSRPQRCRSCALLRWAGVDFVDSASGLNGCPLPGPRQLSGPADVFESACSRPGPPLGCVVAVCVRQMATARRPCCHQRRRAAPTVVPPTRRRADKSRCASARRSASRAGDGRPRRSSAHFARQANDRPKDAGPNGQRRRLGHRRLLAAARNSQIRRMFNAAATTAAT